MISFSFLEAGICTFINFSTQCCRKPCRQISLNTDVIVYYCPYKPHPLHNDTKSSYLQSINRESIILIKPSYTYLKINEKKEKKKNGISKSTRTIALLNLEQTPILVLCVPFRSVATPLSHLQQLQHYVHPITRLFLSETQTLHTRFIAFEYSFWPMAKLL